MATRDLFETRRTNAQGDTEWLPSILVQGAMDGDCVILDGLHRLPHDNIAALSRLLLDGCVDLPSGKRVYANENFRVVALAEPPSSKNPWLRSDAYPLFSFTELSSSSSNVGDGRDIVRGVRVRSARIEMTSLAHLITRMSSVSLIYIIRESLEQQHSNARSNSTKTHLALHTRTQVQSWTRKILTSKVRVSWC